jgi:UDP-N-acetyl-D-glucosamine dehydrogenase
MGGHCLPVDPFYLAFKAREHDFYPEFIELAGKVNRAQPAYCVDLVARALNDAGKAVHGASVLVLGVSYKTGVGDTRESPALQIIRLLRELGAEVSYHDPHVAELPEFRLSSVELASALMSADAVAIITAHPELDYEEIVETAPLVVDFRGVTRGIRSENLVRL